MRQVTGMVLALLSEMNTVPINLFDRDEEINSNYIS